MNTDETLSYIMIAVSLYLTLGTSLLYSFILILGINYKARKKFIGKVSMYNKSSVSAHNASSTFGYFISQV